MTLPVRGKNSCPPQMLRACQNESTYSNVWKSSLYIDPNPIKLWHVITLHANTASRACDVVVLRYPSCTSIYSERLRNCLSYTGESPRLNSSPAPCDLVYGNSSVHIITWKCSAQALWNKWDSDEYTVNTLNEYYTVNTLTSRARFNEPLNPGRYVYK